MNQPTRIAVGLANGGVGMKPHQIPEASHRAGCPNGAVGMMSRDDAREFLQNLNCFLAETVTDAEYEADIEAIMRLGSHSQPPVPKDAKLQ